MEKRKKTGGRSRGTPNRLTYQTRLVLLEAIRGEIENIPQYLQSVSEQTRLEILVKLLPYVVPKPAVVDADQADQMGLLSESSKIDTLSKRNQLQERFESIETDVFLK